MNLKKATNGTTNLYIWREGDEVYRQKGPILEKEFNVIMYNLYPKPAESNMIYHDVAKDPLPYPDNSFDAIDCYHVYEHLSLKEGDFFSSEVHRILKPGGIYRVSVPDLEMISGEYIKYLEASLKDPSDTNLKRYRWSVMKLIEQSIRDTWGGLMLKEIKAGNFDREYVKEHYGEVFDVYFREEPKRDAPPPASAKQQARPFGEKLAALNPGKIKNFLKRCRDKIIPPPRKEDPLHDMRFNRETVTYLPDRLYLRIKLQRAGFIDFTRKDFKSSDIPNWDKYDLDRSNNGDVPLDPSLYVEARKKGPGA